MVVIVVAVMMVILVVLVVRYQARQKRRARLLVEPLPDDWEDILVNNLSPYTFLSNQERQRLHGTMNVFLDEKHFEGCGGLEITDEMRVLVAAQACMLLLNRPIAVYPRLLTILIYPSTYVAGTKGVFNRDKEESVRLGESWSTGVVVLAWDSVKGGAVNFNDGHNVTLHEFAHQLDQEDGTTEGAPLIESPAAYRTWARILTEEYESLQSMVQGDQKTLLDPYGATNHAEFFAVATETFFEKPRQLYEKRPELFLELKKYYQTDPLTWEH